MYENIHLNRLNHIDINMYQCGMEECTPGHSFGPAVRDHYLIHYVHSGRGVFQVGSTTHHLEKGQGFLICPEIVTYYQADLENPWVYTWIGFHGLKAEMYLQQAGLTSETPIFKYDKDEYIDQCFKDMVSTKALLKSREIRLTGLLYIFLSQLIEINRESSFADLYENRREEYVKKAIQFIGMNYYRKISVQEIARHLGLDRSYFCTIFKRALNMPPQEFLVNYRVNKACELMKNNSLTIGDISRSVGYDDPLLFSKMFTKIKGISPRKYRKDY